MFEARAGAGIDRCPVDAEAVGAVDAIDIKVRHRRCRVDAVAQLEGVFGCLRIEEHPRAGDSLAVGDLVRLRVARHLDFFGRARLGGVGNKTRALAEGIVRREQAAGAVLQQFAGERVDGLQQPGQAGRVLVVVHAR